MNELTVQEVYVSCKAQKIFGKVYSPGEVIDNAAFIPTLPALIKTNCVTRHVIPVVPDPETGKVDDLGSSQFIVSDEAPKPKPKTRKKRGRPRKKV